jgi:hypothetical protein
MGLNKKLKTYFLFNQSIINQSSYIKMSLCIYPTHSTSNFELRSPDRFRGNEIKLNCFVKKSELDKIIQHILIDFCNITVLGYDKNEDTYWCKNYDETSCILYIKIQINFNSFDSSEISILPITGDKNNIHMFIYDFNDAIQMYKTSNFIKSLLHKH